MGGAWSGRLRGTAVCGAAGAGVHAAPKDMLQPTTGPVAIPPVCARVPTQGEGAALPDGL